MKRWSWLFVVLLLIAGCTAGRTPDPVPNPAPVSVPAPTPSPVPESAKPEVVPSLVRREVDRGVIGRHAVGAEVLAPATTKLDVGEGPVVVTWIFDQPVEGWERLIQVQGAKLAAVSAEGQRLQAHFDRNPDRWIVSVDGVSGSEIELLRVPQPTVRVYYRAGTGGWLWAEGGELRLPPGPLTLDLDFKRHMSQASLKSLVEGHPEGAFRGRWSDSTLYLEFDQVPERLDLNLELLRGDNGLPLIAPPLVIRRTDDLTPYLERYNLATGQSERVAAAVPNIYAASLSPDKRFALFRYYEQLPEFRWETKVALLDLSSGSLIPAPLEGRDLRWLPDSTLVDVGIGKWRPEPGWVSWHPVRGGEPTEHPEDLVLAAISPDGRTAAVLGSGPSASEPGKRFWRSLILIDLATGVQQVVENFVHGFWFPKGGFLYPNLVWSPDGDRVAAPDFHETCCTFDLVAYDVRTGEREVLRSGLGQKDWGKQLAWSPAGTAILAHGSGPTNIIPLAAEPLVQVQTGSQSQVFWDQQGERVLSMERDWKRLFVYHLQTGERTALGDGWPVGWDGDWVYLIRWGASDGRWIPQGL